VPTLWSQLTIENTLGSDETGDDVEVNALEYLKTFFGYESKTDEEVESLLPFFGDALGDTYGFGMTTARKVSGSSIDRQALVFYYDVPLDVNYSIDSSLKKIADYLVSLGFEKNEYGEYIKGDIGVIPVDSSLDLVIYVWKV
jgi:hypothetical protein